MDLVDVAEVAFKIGKNIFNAVRGEKISEEDKLKVDFYKNQWSAEYYRSSEFAINRMVGRIANNEGNFEELYAIREVLKNDCGMTNADINDAVIKYRNT